MPRLPAASGRGWYPNVWYSIGNSGPSPGPTEYVGARPLFRRLAVAEEPPLVGRIAHRIPLVTELAADPRVPCPRCGEGIRAGARKCPHCRRYLDPQLAADRRQQIADQAAWSVDAEEIRVRVKDGATLAGIAALPLFFVGPVAGPMCLGYALWYHQCARRLQMEEPPRLRLLYGFAGLWTFIGVLSWALMWHLRR